MGNKVVDMKKFKQQTAEEQLLVAKEVGKNYAILCSGSEIENIELTNSLCYYYMSSLHLPQLARNLGHVLCFIRGNA